MKKYLTYDDVNIVPKYSELESRSSVSMVTKFTKLTELQIPIVSSPMDTVTGYEMAKEMMDWGGVGACLGQLRRCEIGVGCHIG